MPQAAAFDQVEQFLAEVFGVVSGALDGLGHQQQIGAVVARALVGTAQVAPEDGMTGLVNFGIGADDPGGRIKIAAGKTAVDPSQHFFQDLGHLRKIVGIFGLKAGCEFL